MTDAYSFFEREIVVGALVGDIFRDGPHRSIMGICKELMELFLPKRKDPEEIRPDEERVNESSSEHVVVDHVAAECAPGHGFKNVLVVPAAIRTANLLIDETCGRVPSADQALPSNGNAVQREPIVVPAAI
jgi:hypothetical protein